MQPLVSIVLPTHNGARYLDGSIQSVVDQTRQDWELILVDDASSDSTPQIIANWTAQDARIRSLTNAGNLRLPASLNRGFTEARGKYFTWTSDDNLYRPQAIERMVEVLERYPACGLVYTGFSEIDDDGHVTKVIRPEGPETLAFGNCVRASFLYRADVARKVGDYRSDLFLAEDWDYWLRIAEEFEVRLLQEDLYLYRFHERSLSVSRAAQVRETVDRLLNHHLPLISWAGDRSRARGYVYLMQLAEEGGNESAAQKYFRQAFALSPSTAVRQCRRRAIGLLVGPRLAGFITKWRRGLPGAQEEKPAAAR